MVAYLRVISAPLGISLLVMSVQWICKGALELGLAGCLISAGLLALAPSTALAMAVEFHHLLKVPGEVIEGLQRSDPSLDLERDARLFKVGKHETITIEHLSGFQMKRG